MRNGLCFRNCHRRKAAGKARPVLMRGLTQPQVMRDSQFVVYWGQGGGPGFASMATLRKQNDVVGGMALPSKKARGMWNTSQNICMAAADV